MKVAANLVHWTKGIIFIVLWWGSILYSVYFLYTPLLLLLLINRRWYRICCDVILAAWEMYPACLLEIWMGSKVYLKGDFIDPKEGAIIIMNHRNRLDWFFFWAAMLHGTKPPAHRCKFVLKDSIKHIPGIGWGMQLCGFLYINRNWSVDQSLIARSLQYFKHLGVKYQILIFPEGTNLNDSTKQRSNQFANMNGLPEYNYVLHPRTRGFVYLVKQMRENHQIDAVYDITIGYPKTLPSNELDVIRGEIPEEVQFDIKRYGVQYLPEAEEELKEWCEQVWSEKEQKLRKFYEEKKFDGAKTELLWNSMYLGFVVYTGFTVGSIYLTFTCCWVTYWVMLATFFYIVYSITQTGLQQTEIDIAAKLDNIKIQNITLPTQLKKEM